MATPHRRLRYILARRFVLITIATLLLQLAYTVYQYGRTPSDLIETALERDIDKLGAAATAPSGSFVLPAAMSARYAQYPENYGFEILDAGKSVVASMNAEIFSDITPSSTEIGETTSIRDFSGARAGSSTAGLSGPDLRRFWFAPRRSGIRPICIPRR